MDPPDSTGFTDTRILGTTHTQVNQPASLAHFRQKLRTALAASHHTLVPRMCFSPIAGDTLPGYGTTTSNSCSPT